MAQNNNDSIVTLKDCLFTLVSSLNTVLDRLDILTDRNEALIEMQEKLISQNQKAFELAREDFFKKIIEAEVDKHANKHTHNNKQSAVRRINFGSDIVRKVKRS